MFDDYAASRATSLLGKPNKHSATVLEPDPTPSTSTPSTPPQTATLKIPVLRHLRQQQRTGRKQRRSQSSGTGQDRGSRAPAKSPGGCCKSRGRQTEQNSKTTRGSALWQILIATEGQAGGGGNPKQWRVTGGTGDNLSEKQRNRWWLRRRWNWCQGFHWWWPG